MILQFLYLQSTTVSTAQYSDRSGNSFLHLLNGDAVFIDRSPMTQSGRRESHTNVKMIHFMLFSSQHSHNVLLSPKSFKNNQTLIALFTFCTMATSLLYKGMKRKTPVRSDVKFFCFYG